MILFLVLLAKSYNILKLVLEFFDFFIELINKSILILNFTLILLIFSYQKIDLFVAIHKIICVKRNSLRLHYAFYEITLIQVILKARWRRRSFYFSFDVNNERLISKFSRWKWISWSLVRIKVNLTFLGSLIVGSTIFEFTDARIMIDFFGTYISPIFFSELFILG